MANLWRQLGILPSSDMKDREITVIGVGGIGSPTVYALCKMGFPKITVFDLDSVESHNIATTMYRIQDIGTPKVLALQDIMSSYSETQIVPVQEKFTRQSRPKGIVISGVDSMEDRIDIWEALRFNIHVPLYIDARMGAEVLRIFTVKPTDRTGVRWYESTLYTGKRVIQAPCTERAIYYTVSVAAGLISNQVKKFVKSEELQPEIVFDMKNLTLMLK